MKVLIRGEKVKITKPMEQYAIEKLSKLDKYVREVEDIEAHVLFKDRKHINKVEVTIPLKHFVLRAEEEQSDFYAAIDVVVDKLERQIKKHKTKLTPKNEKMSYDFVIEEEVNDEDGPKVVKRKALDLKPMSEEEAILQMELLHHEFFLYKSSDGSVSLLYKRKDGNYGVIEVE